MKINFITQFKKAILCCHKSVKMVIGWVSKRLIKHPGKKKCDTKYIFTDIKSIILMINLPGIEKVNEFLSWKLTFF